MDNNFSTMSDEDLAKAAGADSDNQFDFSKMSDDDLARIAGTEKPEVGKLESFGRGAANAFALGYSPQLIAGIKTGQLPGSDNPEYVKELDKQKSSNDEAWNQHPWLYGTGMAAAAVPAAVNAIVAGPEEAALAGGAGLLAESGNIGSLAGAGLRALTGGSKVADVISNPVVQGAIYGSSEGDTLSDKLSGAVSGAIGAKVAPSILSGVGKTIGWAGSKIAPEFSERVAQLLKGGVSKSDIAGAIGKDVGFSVPGFAVSDSKVLPAAMKLDITNSPAKASALTQSEIGGKLKEFSGTANPNDTGEAIRNAVGNWLQDAEHPNGFQAKMEQIYEPIRPLEETKNTFDLSKLKSAIDAARISPMGVVSDLEPTLAIAEKALSNPDGLNFAEIKELRHSIRESMDFKAMPGSNTLNKRLLQSMYNATTNDMRDAAKSIGGDDAVQAFNEVNKNAQSLYRDRDAVLRIVGHPDPSGGKAKAGGNIYQAIANSAARKSAGPNVSDVKVLQNAINSYDPEAWSLIPRTYIAEKIAPQGQFSFENLSKAFGSDLHPEGKSILFGGNSSSDLRQTLDKIEAFGQLPSGSSTVGKKIDKFAPMAQKGFLKSNWGDIATGAAESAIYGGLPLRTIAGAGLSTLAGRYGARDVAKALPTYTPSAAERGASKLIRRAAPTISAQGINPLGSGAVKAAVPYIVSKGIEQLPESVWSQQNRQDGGAVERSSHAKGGAVGHQHLVDRLMRMAEQAKKASNASTEPLLNAPDEAVIKALDIAQRHI